MSEEKNPENYVHIVDYPGQEEPNLIPILRSSAKFHHMVPFQYEGQPESTALLIAL